MVSFPIQGFAQNPNSVTLQEVKPLPKPEIKFKGWYFGADIGVANSSFRYRIPEDPVTGLYAQNSTFFGFGDGHVEAEIGSSFFAELKAKCVAGKYLTIDFINLVKYDQVPITLYEYVSTGWFSGSMVPREKYELNLTTNQFLIVPHFKTGNPNHYVFVGLGVGISTVINRGGDFSQKYPVKKNATIVRADIGFAFRVKENYINFTFSGNSISRIADYKWSAKMNYSTFTFGYALPISAFKRKTKTATL
jgi:hypothetical protein